MVYGRASQEDIEVYEDLNARIDALGREPTAQNKRERAVLVKQRDEMVKKYNADVPDDVKVEKAIQRQQKLYDDFLNDQGAMKEVKSFMGRWAKASVKEKATIAAEIAKSLNQKEAYAKQIADRLNKLSKQSFKNGDEFKAALTSVVGGNTADQNKTMLSIMRGIGKNTESGRYADKLVANSHKHSRAVRDFLLTDKQARTGLLKSIRDAFPLRALFEGEESMALGDTIADRTILKKVFGTDNFDEIEQKLTIRDEPPPPSIVYQAKTGGSAIPIAEIVSRPDGIAYGSTWKLIMAVHDDFAKLLQQANRDILGEVMEVKKPIFKRVPPGDRWMELDDREQPIGTRVFPSLTESLEHYFQKTGNRQYYIDAAQGTIFKVVEEADPVIPPKQFSIYGDGY